MRPCREPAARRLRRAVRLRRQTDVGVSLCWQWAVGWDAECGGVWWEVPAKTQKNAVTNLEMLLAGTTREYPCEYPL